MRLKDKVALITGAAAAVPGELMGFGGATAHLFVHEGARVVISDVRDESGERAAAALREIGGEALYLHLDVTSEEAWRAAVEATITAYGRLDVLVNNAGGCVSTSIETLSPAEWDMELATHAKGVFLGTRHAIPAMRAGGGGSIVNVSSIAGIVGSATSPAYSAAKGAIRLFTKATALQYAHENIRANSVHPGYADTPMTAEQFAEPAVREELLGKTPLRRLGTADDVAYGILYLACDESSFVTGSELVIDGGVTAQ